MHPCGSPYYKHIGRFTYLTEANVGDMITHTRLVGYIQMMEITASKLSDGEGRIRVANNEGTIEDKDIEVVLRLKDDI